MSHWPVKILGDHARTTSGATPSRDNASYWHKAEIPWVKTGEIDFLPITTAKESISEKAINECSLTLLPENSVLIAIIGEGKTRGRSAVLEIEATTNQNCFAILPNETWDSNFLQLWLRSQYDYLRNLSSARGGSQSALNGAQLNALKIPAPDREEQRRIATCLKAQLAEVETARQAAQTQLKEISRLAHAIVVESVRRSSTSAMSLRKVLAEVRHGIGANWTSYPVLGATRDGLAPAKERPGKQATKYKPVTPGTVFYNPMRILIGSIAYVDDDDTPGITSPDYVALQGKPDVVDSRWFYHWLRSPLGVRCIASLARGAVRERMLFNRLAEGTIDLPTLAVQRSASAALKELRPVRAAIEKKLQDIEMLPQRLLAQAFEK
ncbi:restriction endonuclease subunit S [Azospirillum sp. YIM B02556]|uniref:Restriction endonuclease subunit S n=1 Tax=Azospirillum endophyticum TaxID=2800326 RepID=A0ABS1F616_9PROT|nr:restriction endonuclease subunit S [Azospirillum endophyticum]MBK1838853.1 restriction endonuclease subunit S [Azospirillum endophyticum]